MKNIKTNGKFHQLLKKDLEEFLQHEYEKYPCDDLIKIDLHCHDYNSDVPDELIGRILNIPETWLKTERLIKELKKNQCDVFTITNHNNARSCYELQEKGFDVITGAEFSCYVPDYNTGIHVLAYGFTKEQEKKLNKFRKDVYQFQEYCCKENIPTIWAHPLYHYTSQTLESLDFFNKIALIFERFEVINGQRDTWQNMVVKTWLEKLTPDIIDSFAEKYKIDPKRFCKNPYLKVFTGGSDSHIGLFAGLTGSYLYVPELSYRLKNETASELALEAIRDGRIIPFGSHNNSEKLTIAFLDYVFQVAMFYKDPGLLQILLHKGNSRDKIIALIASNGFAEMKNHKTTMRFIKLFHGCFMGKVPSFEKKWLVPKAYKSLFKDALEIAETNKEEDIDIVQVYHDSILQINQKLNKILFARILKKLEKLKEDGEFKAFELNLFLEKLEIPSEIRTLFHPSKKHDGKQFGNFRYSEFLDGLSLPFLSSSLILAANFTSARVLYNNRQLLSVFSEAHGKYKHPERLLWLTDTFNDDNGVSTVLKSVLKEIQNRDLPIDMIICSNVVEPEEHLIVVKPELEFNLPFYTQQPLRIPNFLTIHEIFQQGEYDRIICSTEGPMGLAAIYLKNAFSIKSYFYIHTDWIMFAKKTLQVDAQNLIRVRRFLRFYYKSFDSVFVLNTDQQKWLRGKDMGFNPGKVFLTAHWVDDIFKPQLVEKEKNFGLNSGNFVILYSGRLSIEKGVLELPGIFHQLIEIFPNLKMVFAGNGPAEKELRKKLPEAIYLGWVEQESLPGIYSSSDILILPSRFDTFSCSVLEAISCGLPVIAYNTKGPKDIIQDKENGFLVNNPEEMKKMLSGYIADKTNRKNFRKRAIERAAEYNKKGIMNKLMADVGLLIVENE